MLAMRHSQPMINLVSRTGEHFAAEITFNRAMFIQPLQLILENGRIKIGTYSFPISSINKQ